MTQHLQPWHIAFVWAVVWVNRQQNLVIDYLCTENRALREQVGKKRILLTNDQRRRLAVKAKSWGAGAWSRSRRLSHQTRSCVGIGG